MALDVSDALDRGYRRTTVRNGLLLVGLAYVLNLVNGVFGPEEVDVRVVGGTTVAVTPDPLVAVPVAVDAFLGLAVLLGGLFLTLGALRTFVGDATDRLPADAFTRNAGAALVNLFVGGIAFVVVVALGLVALVVPGLFLLVALVFWDVYVAVEDDSFVEGFRRSWRLTEGDRLSVFVLGVAYLVVALGVSLVFTLASVPFGEYGVFVAAVGNAATTVFAYATLASAYVQLTAEPEPGDADGGEPEPAA